MSFSLRRLELGDLDAIERIERASYPTPWSRSMFASELAKQSSLSIAAVTPDEQLVGYLVLSRYVDAWHVMNVAVDPEHRRLGIASAMLARLFEVTRDDAERGYTLEVRVSNLAAIGLYESFGFVSRGVRRGYYTDNREDAVIMWRDPDPTPETTASEKTRHERRRWQRRTRELDEREPRVILGIETSCDETAAAVVTADGQVLSSIVASQAELHARYGGVVPEVASRRHLELIGPVVREALDEAAIELGDLTRIGVTRGPGLIGALLVGLSAAKAIAWSRGIPLVPVDHLQGHVASLYLGEHPSSRRSSACSRAAGTRCCWPCASAARSSGSARRSTTPPARRSTRARGCSGCRTRAAPRSTRSPARAIPRRSGSRSRACPASTSPSPASRPSLLYAVRDLGERPALADAPRRPRCLLPAGDRASRSRSGCARRPSARGIERIAVVGGVAANSELRAALPGCGARAALALHRQRRDDRVGGAVRRPLPRCRGLDLDAYASAA